MGLPLEGRDFEIWGSRDFPHLHASDLIQLRARHQEDFLSRWLRTHTIIPFFNSIGRKFAAVDPVLGIFAYEDSKIVYIAHLLITAISSTLLIASITVLNFISSMNARLGAIAGFVVLFSFSLSTIVKCKGTEIFAITSA
jgi:hypothetical protein